MVRWAILGCLLVVAGATRAGDDRPHREAPADLQIRINDAIGRGVAYLQSIQGKDGSWEYPNAEGTGGLTALALYALAASRVRASDPSIVRGLRWVEKHRAPYTAGARYATYSVSLLLLALTRIDAEEHKKRIHELAGLLVEGELPNDMWSYALVSGRTRRRDERVPVFRGGAGDNSNSQFAVLALWASTALADFEVPRSTWQRVQGFYASTQLSDGGWCYRPTGAGLGGGTSMTSAGLCSYVYATAALAGGISALPMARTRDIARRGQAALLGGGFLRGMQDYYFVYSLERAGTVMAIPEDVWYIPGAQALVAAQAKNGRWGDAGRSFGDKAGAYETALALLFLSRATRAAVTPGGDPGAPGFSPTTEDDSFPDPGRELARAFEWYVAFKPADRARVLAEFGKAGPAAVDLCLAKLRDPKEDVRGAAGEMLAGLVEHRFFFEASWPEEERAMMLTAIDAWWAAHRAKVAWDPARKLFRER